MCFVHLFINNKWWVLLWMIIFDQLGFSLWSINIQLKKYKKIISKRRWSWLLIFSETSFYFPHFEKLLIKMISYFHTKTLLISAQDPCKTPDNQDGLCIPVQSCTAIWNAIVNKDHINNSEVGIYLRNSQCGVSARSHKVCCTFE